MVDRVARRISFVTFRNQAFLLAAACFALNYGLGKVGAFVPLLQYYGNDLLCMPLVLTVTLFLQRNFTYRTQCYTFTRYHVGIAVVYYALAFEAAFPLFMPRYTADVLDVAAYALGAVFFYCFINIKPIRKDGGTDR